MNLISKILYGLGRLYLRLPFPLYVSVLLTFACAGLFIYWLFF